MKLFLVFPGTFKCIFCFSGVLGTIAKLCKTCVLRITSDKLYFILLEKAISGGTHTWCELTQVKINILMIL